MAVHVYTVIISQQTSKHDDCGQLWPFVMYLIIMFDQIVPFLVVCLFEGGLFGKEHVCRHVRPFEQSFGRLQGTQRRGTKQWWELLSIYLSISIYLRIFIASPYYTQRLPTEKK